MTKVNPMVVEIGCLRRNVDDPGIAGDGGSTPIIAWATKMANGTLHCCDINQSAIDYSMKALEHYGLIGAYVSFYVEDGMKFVQQLPNGIDAIYIDGLDFGGDMIEASMDWHLKIFATVEPKLAPGAIIMFDDIFNTTTWYGKGGKAIPYMIENGYSLVHKGYQVILRKEN